MKEVAIIIGIIIAVVFFAVRLDTFYIQRTEAHNKLAKEVFAFKPLTPLAAELKDKALNFVLEYEDDKAALVLDTARKLK